MTVHWHVKDRTLTHPYSRNNKQVTLLSKDNPPTTTITTETRSVVLRDDKGRLLKGTKGISPGRPKRTTEHAYLHTLQRECTLDVWADITRQAITDALSGDRHARKWLSDYLLGPPIQRLAAQIESSDSPITHDIDETIINILAIFQQVVSSEQISSSSEDISILDGECEQTEWNIV